MQTYKICLGSSNILMAPDDEYVCIVAARGDTWPKLYLPFEEDGGMLSTIPSKPFLLADDKNITDRSITTPDRPLAADCIGGRRDPLFGTHTTVVRGWYGAGRDGRRHLSR